MFAMDACRLELGGGGKSYVEGLGLPRSGVVDMKRRFSACASAWTQETT